MPDLTPEQRRKQLLMDYKATFATEQGLRVLADLRRALFADRQTFVSERPHDTSFNSGVRDAWLYLNRQIEADPAKMAKRQSETIDTEGETA